MVEIPSLGFLVGFLNEGSIRLPIWVMGSGLGFRV